MMFYKPFRYEVTCTNAGEVFDKDGRRVCEVCRQTEDALTTNEHIKLQLVVDALNQVTSEFVG